MEYLGWEVGPEMAVMIGRSALERVKAGLDLCVPDTFSFQQMRSWRQVRPQVPWLTVAQRTWPLPWRTACPRRCRIPSPS